LKEIFSAPSRSATITGVSTRARPSPQQISSQETDRFLIIIFKKIDRIKGQIYLIAVTA
jgi:hypothetical protein